MLLRSVTFQGMKYLHNSPVKLHGNLTSSHCMIDSHWVVSITDWGLHNFRAGQEKVDSDANKMYAGKKGTQLRQFLDCEQSLFCFKFDWNERERKRAGSAISE